MTKPYDRALLHQVVGTARLSVLNGGYRTNTCVLTTHIIVEALTTLGIKARPISVVPTVGNLEGLHLTEQGVPVSEWPDTAWTVGVNPTLEPAPGRWNGHLVVEVRHPNRLRTLIDGSADQFARPERGLHVRGPVLIDFPAGFLWSPGEPLMQVFDDVFYSYRPAIGPGANQWQNAGDWTADISEIVTDLVAAVADA